MSKSTQYEIDSHKWRKNSESKSSDYCGSCSLELHTEQVRDPDSWVSEYMINTWKAEWEKDHAPTEIESLKTHIKELEARLERVAELGRWDCFEAQGHMFSEPDDDGEWVRHFELQAILGKGDD